MEDGTLVNLDNGSIDEGIEVVTNGFLDEATDRDEPVSVTQKYFVEQVYFYLWDTEVINRKPRLRPGARAGYYKRVSNRLGEQFKSLGKDRIRHVGRGPKSTIVFFPEPRKRKLRV